MFFPLRLNLIYSNVLFAVRPCRWLSRSAIQLLVQEDARGIHATIDSYKSRRGLLTSPGLTSPPLCQMIVLVANTSFGGGVMFQVPLTPRDYCASRRRVRVRLLHAWDVDESAPPGTWTACAAYTDEAEHVTVAHFPRELSFSKAGGREYLSAPRGCFSHQWKPGRYVSFFKGGLNAGRL